ncbi:hypothetical protein EDD71_102118 [Fonticella tunisiensis]|uniref:Uncharacterized protein n=2 Tax=Fonticella tunisiensis TaxID=1096341 RepID=A0A4R7KTD8_9CLOT|nr:hypothetical protein EDD71_102118 [Fonticella tunisiensis]
MSCRGGIMGKYVVLKCTSCGRESEIAWGKEFYVSSRGEEKIYGYPEPVSEEAKTRGISGFWVDKVCKSCGEVIRESRYIEDPTDEYAEAWVNFPKVDIIEECTSCHSKDILTLYEVIVGEEAKIPCSRCREGKMEIKKVVND